jgi:hypothetical protein
MMRDARINRIIEGTDEIQHLFIAREALDKHMRLAMAMLNPKAPLGEKLSALGKSALFYPFWYVRLWLPTGIWPRYAGYGNLGKHMRFVERSSRRLARTLFHKMVARMVEIGTELFAMAAACSKAVALEKQGSSDPGPRELADLFCRQAQIRICQYFIGTCWNTDLEDSKVAGKAMEAGYAWLEKGIIVDDGMGFQKASKKKKTAP